MKKLLALLLLIPCFLISCTRPVTSPADTTETEAETTAVSITEIDEQTTSFETETPLPCLIGFYDEITTAGTYTRITEWNDPWILGKDIAVFDVIPSDKYTLIGSSYKDLWNSECDKISKEITVKPYFLLEYTLEDGTEKTAEIKDYRDAKAVIDEGYLEVYLYDDIHQNGGWYYHLTEETTNDETVISSFKLTAGKNIESVKSIYLSVYMDGSSAARIEIKNSGK